MKHKIAVGIVAVILIVAVAVLVFDADVIGQDDAVKYNYSIELTDEYYTGSTILSKNTPSSGYQFALVTFNVKNISYEQGFSALFFQPTLVVDGTEYEVSAWETLFYPDYEFITIEEGDSGSFTMVFEVPEDATVSGITVKTGYSSLLRPPNMRYGFFL